MENEENTLLEIQGRELTPEFPFKNISQLELFMVLPR
jgi:hypothetical protein